MDSIKILGNRIDCFPNYNKLYDFILADPLKEQKCMYITVNNVHTMMEGYSHASYQTIINNSYLSIPDGKPLQIVGKLKGNKEISRLFGPSLMEKFIDWGRKDKIRHFFIGSTENNLQKLKAAVEFKYPGTIITGLISPPYKPFDEWDNNVIIQQINEARPDFIWIGLGAPKQERWMYEQHTYVHKGVMFGIGAGLDYLSGNIKHAPVWMKNLSLEWVYRLVQEPRRLWKRYLTTIPPFMFLTVFELLNILFKKRS